MSGLERLHRFRERQRQAKAETQPETKPEPRPENAEIAALRAEIAGLSEENAKLARERDEARAAASPPSGAWLWDAAKAQKKTIDALTK